MGNGHFSGSPTWHQLWVHEDIAAHLHGILQVALHLLQQLQNRKIVEAGKPSNIIKSKHSHSTSKATTNPSPKVPHPHIC